MKLAPVIGQLPGTGLVGQDDVVAGRLAPVGRRGCGLESFADRFDPLSIRVLQDRVGHLVLLGIGGLDVTDGATGAGRHGGDAFIAARTDAGRPLDRCAAAHRLKEAGADLAQVVGEQEIGARTIGRGRSERSPDGEVGDPGSAP